MFKYLKSDLPASIVVFVGGVAIRLRVALHLLGMDGQICRSWSLLLRLKLHAAHWTQLHRDFLSAR